jgi:phosphoribosylaminoimidazole (AIR) synthetase
MDRSAYSSFDHHDMFWIFNLGVGAFILVLLAQETIVVGRQSIWTSTESIHSEALWTEGYFSTGATSANTT